MEKFLKYSPNRDVVFVLGAGTSHPDGVPLQKDLLPMILSGGVKEIEKSEIGRTVLEFIKENFEWNYRSRQFPPLEAVFGFLDYFILQNESLSSIYTNAKIRGIKESLIKIIHYIVNLKTDKKSQVYHAFWDSIKKYNGNISVITLNYDTLLEQAFESLFPRFAYIDYCIHLLNYDHYNKFDTYTQWINPREPVEIEEGTNPMPIKIIKLHGSLNWKYCNCCNQILLTAWDRKIDLEMGKFLRSEYPNIEKTGEEALEYRCPIDGTEFQTLIMPPSYLKTLSHPVFTQLLGEAGREIRASKRIVFIGYSLSDADLHIKALFKKQLNREAEIKVINTKNSERLRLTYSTLSENIEFINSSFEEMVNDPAVMKTMLS